MQLSKVLIADDDYLVIEDLKKTIAWEELGYTICATATNGADALKLVYKHHPDLLITDIIMPSMTGLELIDRVRKDFPSMQILIISSYDEFEYAKSAIAHGVADYILKTQISPLSFSQRLLELSRDAIAKRRYDHAAQHQSLADYFNRRIKEPVSELTDPILHSLLRFKYYFMAVGVRFPFAPNRDSINRIISDNLLKADKAITAQFTDTAIPVRFIFDRFLILGFVAAREDTQILAGIQGAASRLHSMLENAIADPVCVYSRSKSCTLEEFRELFLRAAPVLSFETAFCEGSVRDMAQYDGKRSITTDKAFFFDDFNRGHKSFDTAMEHLTKYVRDRIECRDLTSLQALYIMLLSYLRTRGVPESDLPLGPCGFSSAEMYVGFIRDLLTDCFSVKQNPIAGEQPIIVEKAIRYIHDHFGDHDITVQSISDAVEVSSGRLGVLFRQSLGKSINEYLTDVRIENAVYLLENTSLKIYEVSDRCGFNAPHYFSDIIYKKTGKRPIDYKRLPAEK